MKKRIKYVNRNRSEIVVPDGRGGMLTLAPGQGSFNQYYARCVGEGLLTPVEVGVDAETDRRIKHAIKMEKENTPFNPGTSFLPQSFGVIKDEDHKTYKVRKGMYICNICGSFRSASKSSLVAHQKIYHKVPDEDQPGSSDEQVLMTSKKSVDTSVMNEQMGVGKSRSSMPKPDESVPEFVKEAQKEEKEEIPKEGISLDDFVDENPVEENPVDTINSNNEDTEQVFKCPVLGCNKVFKSERGLNVHIGRAHKDTKSG